MSTSKKKQNREELRRKRLEAEAQANKNDKRQNLAKYIGIGVFAVALLLVAVVVIASNSDDGKRSSSEVTEMLAGIPQNGATLGNPDAPVTIIEFGDLRCPACAYFSTEKSPELIKQMVKTGEAKVEFRPWLILDQGLTSGQSGLAARAAQAAGEQNKLWEYIETFYANQGPEMENYVTDEFLTEIAEKAGVPDIDQWNADRENNAAEYDQQFQENYEFADTEMNFTGTPAFAIVVGNGEPVPAALDADADVEEIRAAIQEAKQNQQ
jgi:protein-disulfide isomerase